VRRIRLWCVIKQQQALLGKEFTDIFFLEDLSLSRLLIEIRHLELNGRIVNLRLECLETLNQQESRLLRVQATEHCIANTGSSSWIESYPLVS
jgi:hypothetical protein